MLRNSFQVLGNSTDDGVIIKDQGTKNCRALLSIVTDNKGSEFNSNKPSTLLNCVIWGEKRAKNLKKLYKTGGRIFMNGHMESWLDDKKSLRTSFIVDEYYVIDYKDE